MIDERIKQMTLAAEIVIHAHRLDTERLAKLTDAKRREPVALDQRKSCGHDPIAAERDALRGEPTPMSAARYARHRDFREYYDLTSYDVRLHSRKRLTV